MNSEEQKRREEWFYSNINVQFTLIFIIVCTDTERGVSIIQRKNQLDNSQISVTVNMQFSSFLWGCTYLYQQYIERFLGMWCCFEKKTQ